MATILKEPALEGSSYPIKFEFIVKRSDGYPPSSVIPNAGLTWSLRNESGEIINNRDQVEVDPDDHIVVVLRGDDLALTAGYPEKRILTVEGTYDSPFGFNLEFIDEAIFQIENLVGKPTT